ncbi:hypothetical protein YUMDRAFT_06288 [Streptomyces sp. OspMP-M45]|nr:hypothetical protein [Streptomyces sp. SID4925]SBU99967.1 hypothetical protein YUMDRAFT_06288 [Streptomyces sp. OspMP-M45]
MTPQDPGVYISPAQMYQEVRSLAQAVGRIESKIDGILDETKDIRTDLGDHEQRLRTLERARWPLPTLGALTGVAGAAAGVLALIR